MTQYLCNIKIASTNCLTKKYRVPFFMTVIKDKIVSKYIDRSRRFEFLTLAQYGRYYCNTHILLTSQVSSVINTFFFFLAFLPLKTQMLQSPHNLLFFVVQAIQDVDERRCTSTIFSRYKGSSRY